MHFARQTNRQITDHRQTNRYSFEHKQTSYSVSIYIAVYSHSSNAQSFTRSHHLQKDAHIQHISCLYHVCIFKTYPTSYLSSISNQNLVERLKTDCQRLTCVCLPSNISVRLNTTFSSTAGAEEYLHGSCLQVHLVYKTIHCCKSKVHFHKPDVNLEAHVATTHPAVVAISSHSFSLP